MAASAASAPPESSTGIDHGCTTAEAAVPPKSMASPVTSMAPHFFSTRTGMSV